MPVSTVAEIEAAIEQLPVEEQRQLREWFVQRQQPLVFVRPKTGAELAAGLPARFHLYPAEADALAWELNETKPSPSSPPAWE